MSTQAIQNTINTNQLLDHVESSTSRNINDVAKMAEELDMTDPQSMYKMQLAMMKMNMSVQMESAMLKSMEDMIKSVVQRM